MKKRKAIIAIIIVGVLGVIGYSVFANSANKKTAALPVKAVTAKKDAITTTVSAKGEVSLEDNELVYSNVEAEVAEVLVEKEDEIQKGDPILRYKEDSRDKILKQIKENELSLRSAKLRLNTLSQPQSDFSVQNAQASIDELQLSLEQHRVDIAQAEKEIAWQEEKLQDAQKDFEKQRFLYDAGTISKAELDQVEADVKAQKNTLENRKVEKVKAEQTIQTIQQNLELAQLKLKDEQRSHNSPSLKNDIEAQKIAIETIQLNIDTLNKDLNEFQEILYSPASGTITKLNVSKGEVTTTEKVLLEISNLDQYVIELDVNERNANKIQLGQKVILEGAVLGKETLPATISKIGNIAEQKQNSTNTERIIPVEVTMDDNSKRSLLKPGFSLEATITVDTIQDAIVIPIISTMPEKDGTYWVYVINKENKLEKKVVTLGAYADLNVQVFGLEEGETIVEQPDLTMTEGMEVSILTDTPEATENTKG